MNETCSMSIDYREVGGERILPFVITLDEENSILAPGPGELQRFCYTVSGVGQDTSQYADLSHLVMSICSDVTIESIRNVSVIIDGDSQQVILGDNVEILDSDPPTGCAGLKFDFGLDKAGGEMSICFSLAQTYAIGPVPVCLWGAARSATGLAICGPVCQSQSSCPQVGTLRATVCVPVTVTPYATVGTPVTSCCGTPVITPGVAECAGTPLGSCSFTISQDVCMTVPVTFGAEASVGDYSVQCQTTAETAQAGCQNR